MDGPQQAASGQSRAHACEDPASTAVDGNRRFGHEDAEDQSGGGAREPVELILPEDRRAQCRDCCRGENGKDQAHGSQGRLRPMPPVDTTPTRVDPERAAAKAEARPGVDPDWAVQTADTIERLVEAVRSNTSDRLVSVTRLVVFGLVAAIMGTAALVLFAIFVVRILDSYLPGGVWAAHLLLGGVFTLAGLLLWQRAWTRPDRER
jgi:hypothetical protein